MTDETADESETKPGKSKLLGVGPGLLVAATLGFALALVADWGTSADAEWLAWRLWPLIAMVAMGVVALGALAESPRQWRQWELIYAFGTPVVLVLAALVVLVSGNVPSPAGSRWPLWVASAVVGVIGISTTWWVARRVPPKAKRGWVVVLVGAAGVGIILLPAAPWRNGLNVESMTTDAPLSAPPEGPVGSTVRWSVVNSDLASEGSSSSDGESSVVASDSAVVIVGRSAVVGLDPVTGEHRLTYTDSSKELDQEVADPTGDVVLAPRETG